MIDSEQRKGDFPRMCKVAAYLRISRASQSIERQRRNVKAIYPDAIIFEEAYTGTKVEGRKEWERLYNLAMNGKVKKIVFDSVSRMSRDAETGFKLYQDLFTAGVELEFIKEPHINTAVYKDNLDKQIAAVRTGDAATDELMEAITGGINRYMMRLAEQQVKLAFFQSEKEVEDLAITLIKKNLDNPLSFHLNNFKNNNIHCNKKKIA